MLIAGLIVLAYLVMGWRLAPSFASRARDLDFPDPYEFALFCAVVWPATLALWVVRALGRLLVRAIERRTWNV